MIQTIYTFILYPLVYFLFWLLSFKNEKVKLGLKIRKHKSWIQPRDETTSWIWFHVASGELEYAKPVLRELKKISTHKILVTYFSPSVMKALEKTPEIDLFVPMPWDTPWHWNEFLNHYQPKVLAIARTDTWPNMIWQTKKKNIPSILFSATLPSHSGRAASFWGRLLYGRIVEDLTYVSCVAEEDKSNFLRLDPDIKISIDGDTRFDQVLFRLQENRPIKNLSSTQTPNTPIFVAGSTWPQDEKILIPALIKPVTLGLKVLIAPHEPTQQHLKDLEIQLTKLGFEFVYYSKLNDTLEKADSKTLASSPVILVDVVGVLADLYKIAQISFVGGSFKKSVHSVMEPAACGNLIIIGPYHHNNREALSLKTKGFARVVDDSFELESILMNETKLNSNEVEKRKSEITDFIKSQTGVSKKIATWINSH
ncbi:MAG: glycosyltransferase N-terminal domain-containing protein [Oligoflexia bacterium]|nr:glycosyltransferase N-terminal domain-containing protein [Oligoflexia bacterium]